MGVNPEDPTAMASIQRVASTFFNAIDKKEGSPYVFREGKQSIIEPTEGLEESEPSVDSDQEELDQFIAEIEDAADKEYEAEEAKEKEELGRIRYWNREEFGGRFRRSDDSRNDDYDGEVGRFRRSDASRNNGYDGEVRGSRAWQTTHPKRYEEIAHSDNDDDDDDDEWHPSNVADDSDIDSNSDEARGRFEESRGRRERKNNISIGKPQVNGSPNRHAEAKFRRNVAIEESESEGMLSDVENAMWESDEEESNDSGHLRMFGDNYKSSSSSDDECAYQLKRNKKNGDSAQYENSFNAPESVFRGSEDCMWHSDDEEDYPTNQNSSNVVKSSDIHKRISPKEADEAWDSD